MLYCQYYPSVLSNVFKIADFKVNSRVCSRNNIVIFS